MIVQTPKTDKRSRYPKASGFTCSFPGLQASTVLPSLSINYAHYSDKYHTSLYLSLCTTNNVHVTYICASMQKWGLGFLFVGWERCLGWEDCRWDRCLGWEDCRYTLPVIWLGTLRGWEPSRGGMSAGVARPTLPCTGVTLG